MRILIDTNVFIDIILDRKEFVEDSLGAINKAMERGDKLFFSSAAVSDVYYIVRKRTSSKEIALNSIKKLLLLFTLAEVNESSIFNAVESNIVDFEDAIIDEVAQYIEADFIITRDASDFLLGKTPIETPKTYLEKAMF